MMFSWNWPTTEATSGAMTPQTLSSTGVQPTTHPPARERAGDDDDLLAAATASYSGAEPAPPDSSVSAVLVAAFQASAEGEAGAPQNAAATASAELAALPIPIANAVSTELNPYAMGAP